MGNACTASKSAKDIIPAIEDRAVPEARESMAGRVVSKNLFNYPLQGVMDEDILQAMGPFMESMATEEFQQSYMAMEAEKDKDDQESHLKYAKLFRDMMDPLMRSFATDPKMVAAAAQTDATIIHVPTSHDGSFDVPVEVYTPKTLAGKTGNPAYIYAHGGGAVASNATDSKPWMDIIAVEVGVVVFNVDYRLAPETKCPNNVKDFYESIKYIKKNAVSLGVDPDRIAIGGDSGGGYICLGSMVMMAQNDETDLIKLALPGIPMVDDYSFGSPECMTVEERQDYRGQRKVWKMIAADWEAQKNDPLLFPGKASEEILEKFPPTVIREVEFDVFLTEATRLAGRLRRAGRLLDFYIIPGIPHGGAMMDVKGARVAHEALKTVLREYLL